METKMNQFFFSYVLPQSSLTMDFLKKVKSGSLNWTKGGVGVKIKIFFKNYKNINRCGFMELYKITQKYAF